MNSKDETIQLKLSKAKSILSEVEVLKINKFYSSVVDRLYFSCFHATHALLLTKDLMPKTHIGTSTTLHKYFVNAGLLKKEQAISFNNLMRERMEDVHNDSKILNEAEVIGFIEPAKQYVEYVSKLIQAYFDDKTANAGENKN